MNVGQLIALLSRMPPEAALVFEDACEEEGSYEDVEVEFNVLRQPHGGGGSCMRSNPAMAERRETIVALLEERPYSTTDLAEALDLESGMHQVCAQLAREKVIKRLSDGRWAHPTHQGQTAPPADIEARSRVDGEAVLAQLQDGPRGCSAIAAALGVGKRAVQSRLDALAAAGTIRSIGQHTGLRWILAGWQPPRLSPGPSAPLATNAAGAPLRQQPPAIATAPSWWIGLDRQELAASVAQRVEGMRSSRENLWVPLRMIQ